MKQELMDAKKAAYIEALKNSMGIITAACESVGLSRSTIRRWKEDDPGFAAAVDEVMDIQCDFVESRLLKLIKEGDTTATIFYLKTKGKKRGYTEKPLPEPKQELTAEESKATVVDCRKRLKAKKDYIIKLLKKEGKYTAELSMQVTLAAQLIIRQEQLQEEMQSPDYQRVLVEYSREGNRREQINPKEKLYMDLSTQVQRALRALGMNTDAKERRSDNDTLGDFMQQFKGE